MTEIFPIIQPQAAPQSGPPPIYRECAWDFETGQPIFRGGNPLIVEGAEAVRVWAWKALVTQRTRWEIYSWDFGSELESLIGQNYTETLKRAEAPRYIQDALLINPYITGVREISTSFAGSTLTIAVTLDTIYGEVRISV